MKVSFHAAQAFQTPLAGRGSALALPSRYAPGADARFSVEGCTNSLTHFCRHLLCLHCRFAKFSRDERPDGSLLAFAWSDVAVAQLLFTSLQSGIRFFHHPIPTNPSAFLTVSFPLRENDGLTTFRIRTQDGLGSACSPVAFHLRVGKGEPEHPATYLLVQAYFVQHLWLVGSHDVYQRFTYVSHTIRP